MLSVTPFFIWREGKKFDVKYHEMYKVRNFSLNKCNILTQDMEVENWAFISFSFFYNVKNLCPVL